MSNLIIEKLLAKTKRTDLPQFAPGDSVRVHVKIKEGDKERLQAFEGVVIARTRGPQASFTVRKISFGHGVERIFPENSRVSTKWTWSVLPRFAAPSCTICAPCEAKQPVCATSNASMPRPPQLQNRWRRKTRSNFHLNYSWKSNAPGSTCLEKRDHRSRSAG